MVYTGYYYNLKNYYHYLQSNVKFIAISCSIPYHIINYVLPSSKLSFNLCPDSNLVNEFKETENYLLFISSYTKQLEKLNANEVYNDIISKREGKKHIVLLCYENLYKFCHRHLLSAWLRLNGYECDELMIDMNNNINL